MQYALALPQGGRAANPDLIRRSALLAEELGFSHVWVNDHITSPEGQGSHISPFMFDPMMTAATVAAVTSTIGVGIQLVGPYYEPLWLANALASLDTLSGGRVLATFGIGWSKPEFEALSSDFHTRGRRMDEILGIIRGAWSEDYVAVDTEHYHLPPVKIAPKPAHPLPLWVSGTSEKAYERAVKFGDGYHGHAVQDITIDNVADRVARVRASRPEESFTFSVYTWEWDLDRVPEETVLAEHEAYEQAGVQHVVIALAGSDPAGRMQVTSRLAELFGMSPR